MSADEPAVYTVFKKKKKPRFVPIQPPPSSLRGTAVEKHVWYAQQVPANSSETLLTNLKKNSSSLSSACADEGSKARMLTHKKEQRKAWWRDQVEFLLY